MRRGWAAGMGPKLAVNVRPVRASTLVSPMPPSSPDLPAPTDDELVTRWLEGDQRAATLLVERHGPLLARFAARSGVRDRGEVEGLVQDTFVKAFGSLAGFRGESSLATWLVGIERRLLIDRRRAQARARQEVELDEGLVGNGATPLDGLVAEETRERLQASLARLTPMQREVFLLRVGEGMAYREIASAVGTSEGAARVHYHNAARAVKEYLNAGV